MKTVKFKIVRDGYLGYEVQIWRIWFPIWVQASFVNTHKTVSDAENFIANHCLYPKENTFFNSIFNEK